MTPSRLGDKLPALSVRTYGAIFALLAFLSVAGLVGLSMQRLEALRAETRARHLSLAHSELAFSIRSLLRETEHLADQLKEWDELVHQLADPTYYTYWRANRASDAPFVPSYFDGLELYDSRGRPLASDLTPGFPPRLDDEHPTFFVVHQPDHDHLYHVSVVDDRSAAGSKRGYASIEIDLTDALHTLQKFRYVDADSIQLDVSVGESIGIDELLSRVRFDVRPNPEFQELDRLMVGTLTGLGTLLTVMTGFGLYVLISMVGLPLRRLSQHIDALGDGQAQALDAREGGLLKLHEFEKLRWSFNDYRNQLSQKAHALEQSEQRIRAVLKNVPDGIIILDRHARIESMNPAALKLFALEAEDIEGVASESLIAEGFRREYRESFGRVCRDHRGDGSGCSETLEILGLDRNGRTFYMDMTFNVLPMGGEKRYIAVVRDITDRKRAEQRLRHMANYDGLTELPNRTLFRDRLEHAVAHAHREGESVGLIFIDLDRFKTINDTLGHSVGDELLIEVAERIKSAIREGDTVARLGGDEFTLILEGLDSPEDCAAVAEKLRVTLSLAFTLGVHEVFVTASMGITLYPDDDTDVDNLLKNADTAMYRAKELGGDSYRFFTPGMNDQLNERLALENALRRAVERQEFTLCYQPRVHIASGRTTSVEALLRWTLPERGEVPPGEFIPILEDTGLIVPVGAWVVEQALLQARRWEQAGISGFRIAVNLSARQFRQRELVPEIARLLAETGVQPDTLELELTEGLLIENVEEARAVLDRLASMGIQISIDDFGTGYSSLHYLKRFPLHTLKIDRSFVRDVSTDPDDAAIVELIIAIASTLGMTTTAEGVETQDQLEFLRGRGCHEAQGFLIGRPMTGDRLAEWLQGAHQHQDRPARSDLAPPG